MKWFEDSEQIRQFDLGTRLIDGMRHPSYLCIRRDIIALEVSPFSLTIFFQKLILVLNKCCKSDAAFPETLGTRCGFSDIFYGLNIRWYAAAMTKD